MNMYRKVFISVVLFILLNSACRPTKSATSTSLAEATALVPKTATAIPTVESTPTPEGPKPIVVEQNQQITAGTETFAATVVTDPNTELSVAARPDNLTAFYIQKDGQWVKVDLNNPKDTWPDAAKAYDTIAADKYFENEIVLLMKAAGQDTSVFTPESPVGSDTWITQSDAKFDAYANWLEGNHVYEFSAPKEWLAGVVSDKENYDVSSIDAIPPSFYGVQIYQKQLDSWVNRTMQTALHEYPIKAPYYVVQNQNIVGVLGAVITPLGENPAVGQLLDIHLNSVASKRQLWRNNYQETQTKNTDLCLGLGSGGLVSFDICPAGLNVNPSQGRNKGVNNYSVTTQVISANEFLGVLSTNKPIVIKVVAPSAPQDGTKAAFWLNGIPIIGDMAYNPPR